ncbi:MAG: hypothetical protein M3O91_04595 [Chloroflexota bacterium]|nr:hypothetical protein [Chloroflexota bacterium]
MSSSNAIIHFECIKPPHREALSRRGVGGLTIHDGAWAYCDAMTADQEHEWAATGGVPQADLVRWSKRASGSIAAQLDFGGTAAKAVGKAWPAPRATSPAARHAVKRPTERAPR